MKAIAIGTVCSMLSHPDMYLMGFRVEYIQRQHLGFYRERNLGSAWWFKVRSKIARSMYFTG